MRRRTFEKILRREGAFSEKFMLAIRKMSQFRNAAAHVRRGSPPFEGEERAWEFHDLANWVEREFAVLLTRKLKLFLHGDPLPTRKELLARVTARSAESK
jgi:hypothetical protein